MADRLPQLISLPLTPEAALMLNVLYLIGEAIMRRDTPAVTKIIRGIAKMAYSKEGEATRDDLRKLMEQHIDVVQQAGEWVGELPDNWLDELKAAVFEVPDDWTPNKTEDVP
jgi:predicted ATP-dependent Lon-type protease